MDGDTLRAMRVEYGVTQEELADELGKSVRTIQRWEKTSSIQRVANATFIGRAICSISKCKGNFAAQYASVILPDALYASIKHSPSLAQITHGEKFCLMVISAGEAQRWPFLTHFLGSDMWDLLTPATRRLFRKYEPECKSLRSGGEVKAIKIVAQGFSIATGNVSQTDTFRLTLTSPLNNFYRYDFIQIPLEEYLEDRPKGVQIETGDTAYYR